jgi:hypothetical protein
MFLAVDIILFFVNDRQGAAHKAQPLACCEAATSRVYARFIKRCENIRKSKEIQYENRTKKQ